MNKNSKPIIESDVIIVGAGISGLVAARELVRQGVSVRILEARNRVGGRVYDHRHLGKYPLPLGPQFTGPGETKLKALVDDLGLATCPLTISKRVRVRLKGKTTTVEAKTDAFGLGYLFSGDGVLTDEALSVIHKMDKLSRTIPLDAPQTAVLAAEWENMSLNDWLHQTIGGAEYEAQVSKFLEVITGIDPDTCSFLFFVYWWGALNTYLIDDRQIVGGAQKVPLRMADELKEYLHLQTPVIGIQQNDEGVVVESETVIVKGNHAIVSIPLNLINRLTYDPPLPSERVRLATHLKSEPVLRCGMIFDTPFWQKEGLGWGLSDEGPLTYIADVTPDDGSCGLLSGLIVGEHVYQWGSLSIEDRQKAILQQVAEFFEMDVPPLREYVEQNWLADEWTKVGWINVLPPKSGLADYGEIWRRPFGRIHWAGTDTATMWTGSMEGAVHAGERAANEVMASINAEQV